VLGGDALDGKRDDVAGAILGGGLQLGLDLADAAGHVLARVPFDGVEQVLARFLDGHLGHAL